MTLMKRTSKEAKHGGPVDGALEVSRLLKEPVAEELNGEPAQTVNIHLHGCGIESGSRLIIRILRKLMPKVNSSPIQAWLIDSHVNGFRFFFGLASLDL